VNEAHAHHADLGVREYALLAPVLAAILVLGVYPKLILDRIEPTTARVVGEVTSATAQATTQAEGGR
jgi:NADH:ubiquinone oxidoreductase subunit 4 (subunit M)